MVQGVGAKALFLRHDGHLGLPCPKSLEGAGALGLKGGPNLAETRAFSSPSPKALAQAKPEWALATGRWPKSIEAPLQAWARLSIASVIQGDRLYKILCGQIHFVYISLYSEGVQLYFDKFLYQWEGFFILLINLLHLINTFFFFFIKKILTFFLSANQTMDFNFEPNIRFLDYFRWDE